MTRIPFRHVLELAVGVLVAVLVVETWLAMGLVVPVVVSGSSMAPTLRGPHRLFHCPDCRGEYTVGLDEEAEDPRAVCPACGSLSATVAGDAVQPGDRLVVNRAAFAWREPRRWEVVVFRAPDAAEQFCVKRVVGLPGERVSLAHGDVLVDGRVVRKTLAEQQAMRQLVHRAAPGSVGLNSLEQPARKVSLLPLGDAMLTAQVRLEVNGQLRMEIDNEVGRFEMTFDAVADVIRVLQGGRPLGETKISALEVPLGSFSEWTFSLFDAQALVAVDGYTMLAVPIDRIGMFGASREHATRPATVAIFGAGGTIAEPAVWRDAYYEYRYGDLRADDRAAPTPSHPAGAAWQLGPEEYFVLGDHAEISDDSRCWLAGPGLDAKLLFGKPLGVR
jgi:signal peptidase I